MKSTASLPQEIILVRPTNPKQRGGQGLYYAGEKINAPFQNPSGGSSDTENQQTIDLQLCSLMIDADQRGMMLARFPKVDWISITPNHVTLEEIVKANKSPQLEFAWISVDGETKHSRLLIVKGGKTVFRYEYDGKTETRTVEGAASDLKAVETINGKGDVMAKVRAHFGIPATVSFLQIAGEKLELVNEQGKRGSQKVCGYRVFRGDKVLNGDPKASKELAIAIDQGDVERARMALKNGASVTALPDSRSTPLETVLWKRDQPGTVEIAELLLEHGASVGKSIESCVRENQQWSVRMLTLILKHGRDSNDVLNQCATALHTAAERNFVEIAQYLVQNGADPTMAIEQVKGQLERESQYSKKPALARMLEILIGERVSVPAPKSISNELAAENERFRAALKAQQLAKLNLSSVCCDRIPKLLASEKRLFQAYDEELIRAGFEQAAYFDLSLRNYESVAGYRHPKSSLCALLSKGNRDLPVHCQIVGYATDDRFLEVSNAGGSAGNGQATPAWYVRECEPGVLPAALIKRMQDVIQRYKCKLVDVSAKEFVKKYEGICRRMVETMRQQAIDVLETPAIFVDDQPARFERMRVYLDFSSWDDPSRSSQTYWNDLQERLNENSSDQQNGAQNLKFVIGEAFDLMCMQHLQFRGASNEGGFLTQGIEAGLRLFENLKGKWKRHLSLDYVDPFAQLLLLCQISGDNHHVRNCCESVPLDFNNPKLKAETTTDPPLDYARFLMLIASEFRTRPIPKIHEAENKVESSRSLRVKMLYAAWKALRDRNADQLQQALTASLENYRELPMENFGSGMFLPYIGVAESIMCHVARDTGINMQLRQDLEDMTISCR